ncbi:hypothetical protein D3C75_1038930 [compost metagenome]
MADQKHRVVLAGQLDQPLRRLVGAQLGGQARSGEGAEAVEPGQAEQRFPGQRRQLGVQPVRIGQLGLAEQRLAEKLPARRQPLRRLHAARQGAARQHPGGRCLRQGRGRRLACDYPRLVVMAQPVRHRHRRDPGVELQVRLAVTGESDLHGAFRARLP